MDLKCGKLIVNVLTVYVNLGINLPKYVTNMISMELLMKKYLVREIACH